MAKIKHDHAVTQMALSNLDAWVNSPRVSVHDRLYGGILHHAGRG